MALVTLIDKQTTALENGEFMIGVYLDFSKVFDTINEFNILYKFQFGFRKDCFTHMALATLIDKLTTALENGEFMIGVYLDFSKAFDTINHQILLDELYHYGIRGVALS